MKPDTIQQIYDAVPYPSYPYAQTYPDYLAVLASLYGMNPPPVTHCRVLEIGCSSGGNLIPMSEALPESTFVGIDLSEKQIAIGQATIAALSLTNISLVQQDIRTFQQSGQFDYIIAHGVYSWVPSEVQEALFALCKRYLAPNGVAYISYNTYPGWHMFEMVRSMMMYHTWGIADPHERATQACTFLDTLTQSIPAENHAFGDFLLVYTDFLKQKMDQAGDQRTAFLIHDELSEVNTPVYFSQFVAHAANYGLKYVTETVLPDVLVDNFAPETACWIRDMAKDSVDVEQYMDFLRGRTFRESLVCHQDVHLDRHLDSQQVLSFHIASRGWATSPQPDIYSDAPEEFCGKNSGTVVIEHALSKAALVYLAEIWPRSVDFMSLIQESVARVTSGFPQNSDKEMPDYTDAMTLARESYKVAANLFKIFTCTTRLVQFRMEPLALGTVSQPYPTVRPLARLQAQSQSFVTNLLHERVTLDDEVQGALLPYLDGTRDRAALVPILTELLHAHARRDDPVLALEQTLEWVARMALVCG